MKKICVYSTFYGLPEFSKDSIKNHLFYCNKHNYSYIPYIYDKPNDRQFSWSKIDLAIDLLKSSQWDAIFWMDGDSWFQNSNIELHTWLDADEPIQFTGDENDIFNGGHFLLKNQPESLEWLKLCWKFCYTKDKEIITTHKDSEQLFDQPGIIISLGGGIPEDATTWAKAFNELNGFPGNPLRRHKNFQDLYAPTKTKNCSAARSLICEQWRPYCLIRPQSSMNSYPWNLGNDDFIVHFVGNTKDLMSKWRDRFEFFLE